MSERIGLFDNVKTCERCNRPLPSKYADIVCPACKEHQLFWEVKEFIRANIVNEHDVAEHFNIPLKKVKGWIREGRIEYRTDNPEDNIAAIHCIECGAPIAYGTLCQDCMRIANVGMGYSAFQKEKYVDSEMRFIDHGRKDNGKGH